MVSLLTIACAAGVQLIECVMIVFSIDYLYVFYHYRTGQIRVLVQSYTTQYQCKIVDLMAVLDIHNNIYSTI